MEAKGILVKQEHGSSFVLDASIYSKLLHVSSPFCPHRRSSKLQFDLSSQILCSTVVLPSESIYQLVGRSFPHNLACTRCEKLYGTNLPLACMPFPREATGSHLYPVFYVWLPKPVRVRAACLLWLRAPTGKAERKLKR